MKRFACGSVVPGCDAIFEGATEADILAQLPDHARDAHDMNEIPTEVVDQVRARITDLPAA